MEHQTHDAHQHAHAAGCGHTAVRHNEHIDYLHDGHLHHPHDQHVDEHVIGVTSANPQGCESGHTCAEHDQSHTHGSACGHETVPHGDHQDYIVAGHLHHQHDSHCDDHGVLATA
ncbi:MAG TPA: hypothetical protein VE591_03010 [Candidatus Acidoferrum sp.]|nr:hypothetical protein [Candidatus Acidoferrum sp.]